LKLEHRFSSNFTWLANYTWSHCISTLDFGNELAGVFYQNQNNRDAEKADCNFDRRHIFNSSLVIQSPGFGNGFMRVASKDWQLSPLVSLYTGQPINVTTASDVSLTGEGTDRPNVVPGVNPNVGSGTVVSGAAANNGAIQWFNPAVFAGGCTTAAYATNPSCVPVGSFGNAARDIFHGPGVIQWDMSASRKFSLSERYKLEFRAEFFNFMNHANLNAPATTLTSSALGDSTTFGAPRLIQFGLKFAF
jgi:hypothetical protein